MRSRAQSTSARGDRLSLPPFDGVVLNARELVTCDGPFPGPPEATLAKIPRGAIAWVGDTVAWLGPQDQLPKSRIKDDTRLFDAQGGVVGPGWVDCHTHLVFQGSRHDEFAMRCAGKTYLEVAKAGGGIVRTVEATRAASGDALLESASIRAQAMLARGVTTLEIKSGYGLTTDTELKMLEAVIKLRKRQPQTFVATLLALHAVPKEFAGRRADYVDQCIQDLLPKVAARKAATFVDAFVEDGAFAADDVRRLWSAAKPLGFRLRLHVDQLTPGRGGAQLAAELGATSADHLEHVSPEGMRALAASRTVAVLAPTSTLFAKARPFAPGRALADAGCAVAVCTNWNPGSSMGGNVSLAMSLACLENGLTPEEAFLGFTRHAGAALALPRAGILRVGAPADIAVHCVENLAEIPYRIAENTVVWVLRHGVCVLGKLS